MLSNDENKVVSFEHDSKFYYQYALSLKEKGRNFEVMIALKKAVSLDSGFTYRLKLAEFFNDHGLYDYAEREYFSILAQFGVMSECFAGLSQAFYLQNENSMGMIYFNKYMMLGSSKEYDDEELDIELVEVMEPEYIDYSVVYPKSKKDYEKDIKRAHVLISELRFNEADKILNKVPKESEQFMPARNALALSRLFREQIDEAVKICDQNVLYAPTELETLCTACMVYDCAELKQKIKALIPALSDLTPDNEEDLMKVCVTLCNMEAHDEARIKLRKLIEMNPFHLEGLLRLGQAEYNHADFARARECFIKILELDEHNFLAKRLLNSATELSRLAKMPQDFQVRYGMDFLEDEGQRELAFLNHIRQMEIPELKEFFKNDFSNTFDFAISNHDSDGIFKLLSTLYLAKCDCLKYIKEVLLSLDLEDKYTLKFLALLIENGEKKVFKLIYRKEFMQLQPHYPKGYATFDILFRRAYGRCITRLFEMHERKELKLSKALGEIYSASQRTNFVPIKEETLCALIVYRAVFLKSKTGLTQARKLFNAQLSDLKNYKSILLDKVEE